MAVCFICQVIYEAMPWIYLETGLRNVFLAFEITVACSFRCSDIHIISGLPRIISNKVNESAISPCNGFYHLQMSHGRRVSIGIVLK